MIVHQVFFWLKDPKQNLHAVLEGCKKIGTLSSALSHQVGTPAATPKRAIIDDSYHLALTVNFRSLKDHDLYQEDPLHHEFIAEHSEKWEKVRIYDFEVE